MAAPAPAPAAAAAGWTPVFRRAVLDKVFEALKGDASRAQTLASAFGLSSSAWTSADELAAGLQGWLVPERDLDELLTKLSDTGLYPASVTGFRWDWSVEALASLAHEAMNRSKRVLDGIAALKPGEHTFANTLEALNTNDRIVDLWSTNISFLGHVSASKPVRDVATDLSKVMSEFEVAQSMRVDLYESFKAFAETSEGKALTGERARYLEFTLRDFRRNGLALPADARARVEALKKRMSVCGIEFSKNLGEENAKFTFTAEELKGVPEDQMQRFPRDGEKYVVTLKYPDYFPVMENCSVESTRKKLEYEYNRRCIDSNTPILEELVKLRAEQAAILGYKNHAAYVLEIRMAKNPEAVDEFLRGLSRKLQPLMEEELAYWRELKAEEARARGESGAAATPDAQTIHAWDMRYFMRLSELRKYKVDDQRIKQYFPLEVVTAGLLDIYQRTLDLEFEEVRDRPDHAVWHESVQLFAVRDRGAPRDQIRGYFYLDLFPREGKYGHAAVWGLQPGCARDVHTNNARQLPVAGMVANFTRPTASQPSLLTHKEVETYFHEFGHVCHQVCSEVIFQRFAGTNVERDLVEAPSQMLENWCYEEEPLLLMSGHVNDHSQKMPVDLLKSIADSKKANAGIFNKRQCILGLFDQYIHTHTEADTAAIFVQISREHWPIAPTPGTNFAAGFGHLAGGYDAQYYGYMWSEVFSADMFETRFKAEGLLNPATGRAYRREIISRGGSVDGDVMLRNFLGRDPNDTAFLRSKGLAL